MGWLQGQCYGHIKRKVYNIKFDQRELMKVCQRNFRKYQTLRSWGWFIIIQKTKPLIGQINLEDELRILEEKASAAYGAYEEAVNVTKTLEAAALKADTEVRLEEAQKGLADSEAARQALTADKKTMEGEISVIKKDMEDLEMALQKLEQEKTNRDHTIRSLGDEVAQVD